MLDASDLKYLDDAQRQELAAFEKLFDSEGWSYVKEMVETLSKATEAGIVEATTWDQARYLKGKLDALRVFLCLREYIEQDAQTSALEGRAAEQQRMVDAEFEYE